MCYFLTWMSEGAGGKNMEHQGNSRCQQRKNPIQIESKSLHKLQYIQIKYIKKSINMGGFVYPGSPDKNCDCTGNKETL